MNPLVLDISLDQHSHGPTRELMSPCLPLTIPLFDHRASLFQILLRKLRMDGQVTSLQEFGRRVTIAEIIEKTDIAGSKCAMATDVVLETSMGIITLELYNNHAPKTCKNFETLIRRNYYNNVIFHRIIPNFMLQTGDPTGTGRGGSSIYGDKFDDELHPGLKHTGAGVLSMANSGPNTNGSQFFITLAPTPWLDGKHTIFGRVKNGLRIVQRMGLVKTGPEDRPLESVTIRTARILDSGE